VTSRYNSLSLRWLRTMKQIEEGTYTRLKRRLQMLDDQAAREAAKKRGEKSMGQRLANEIMEASENRGGAVKRRDEVHRMAEANKAFAHFRF
jgi:hypothetical protein